MTKVKAMNVIITIEKVRRKERQIDCFILNRNILRLIPALRKEYIIISQDSTFTYFGDFKK